MDVNMAPYLDYKRDLDGEVAQEWDLLMARVSEILMTLPLEMGLENINPTIPSKPDLHSQR